MNYHQVLSEIWLNKKEEIETTIRSWAHDLRDNAKTLEEAKKKFHQWEPLRIYTNVTRAKSKGDPVFSLRYCGQEIGVLRVCGADVKVQITDRKLILNNRKWFQCDISGEFNWNSAQGKELRQHFKQLAKNKSFNVGVPEHHVETALIHAMRSSSSKNKGLLLGYQPVFLNGNLPFQMPVPISGASKGLPVYKPKVNGNIDVLARKRCKNNKVILSVWELKKPGTITNHTVAQAYIYAVTLLFMLRSDSGKEWFKIFGFKGNVPDKLTLESVVAITKNHESRCSKQFNSLIKDNPLKIGNDSIKFAVAFYNKDTFNLMSLEDLK